MTANETPQQHIVQEQQLRTLREQLVITEKQLKASEEKYKNLFENLGDEVHLWKLITNKNGEIETWQLADANPAALKAWNKTREEVIGKTTNEIFGYDATTQFMPTVRKIFETGKPYKWVEYFEPTNQYLSMSSIPFGDYFISTGEDITDQKKAEKELEILNNNLEIRVQERTEEILKVSKELELYRLAAEHSESGVWYYDIIRNDLTWDDTMYRLYNIEKEDFSGAYDAWESSLHPEDKEHSVNELNDAIAGKKPFDTIFRIVDPNTGNISHIRAKGKVERDADGSAQAVFGTNWDVTREMQLSIEREEALNNLKETQSQLIQSEKMASLGTLTAGVAHEINNPLNYIMGGYRAISDHISENEDIRIDELIEYLRWIKTGGDRASDIVKSLNQFSRSNDEKNEKCNIHIIIEDCILVLQHNHKDRIQIVRNFHADDPMILGNSGKLHQVILNILSNAIDAIVEEGKVSIQTKSTDSKVEVIIEDNGCGISDENIERIADPFFTTKPPGVGTGLGLSIAKSIISDHDGELNFQSEINKGTTLSIILPRERTK